MPVDVRLPDSIDETISDLTKSILHAYWTALEEFLAYHVGQGGLEGLQQVQVGPFDTLERRIGETRVYRGEKYLGKVFHEWDGKGVRICTEWAEPIVFGKGVTKIANTWHKRNAEVGFELYPDADARREAYLRDRVAAYARIVRRYHDAGQRAPGIEVLG